MILVWMGYGNVELFEVDESHYCVEKLKEKIRKVATGYPADDDYYLPMWNDLQRAQSLAQLQVWANHYTIDDERFEHFEFCNVKPLAL